MIDIHGMNKDCAKDLWKAHTYDIVQDCSNTIASALEHHC